ncbi:MAG: hypothetical protein A2283_03650 [Lentisphaerae bacterium RIFOXYA12_FULL_48_11]|nr:MAG: hypothetical protein A2283_03650 [Lentisphaerae bacterium RIFOXYA12_FULL_48_11]
MKIFGYVKNSNDEKIVEMEEITIQASPADLKKVAKFILKSAELMSEHGDDFGHEHFKDSYKIGKNFPEIIVSK